MALQRQLKLLPTEQSEGEAMPGNCFHVAFATADLKRVDQHFGSAERFAIYTVTPTGSALHEVFEFGALAQDGNENKLLEKFVALDGCLAVYCLAVGPSAVRQLVSLGIQPLKVPFGTPVSELLKELELSLEQGPTGWLSRALESRRDKSESRFDEMEEEGWME